MLTCTLLLPVDSKFTTCNCSHCILWDLQDVFEDEQNVHLVMELCTGGGILDKIKQNSYTERRISQIMRSIIRFISQCHAKGIIYRDIKPDNFLFLNKSENSPIRATDFGLSIR